jgi:hypothetical protein
MSEYSFIIRSTSAAAFWYSASSSANSGIAYPRSKQVFGAKCCTLAGVEHHEIVRSLGERATLFRALQDLPGDIFRYISRPTLRGIEAQPRASVGRTRRGADCGPANDDCPSCKGARWVCETHPDRPWRIVGGCKCSTAMPCVCNPPDRTDDQPDIAPNSR